MQQTLVPVVDALADPGLPGGLTRERIIRAVQSHQVEGTRVAGRWLVDPSSLRAWAESAARPSDVLTAEGATVNAHLNARKEALDAYSAGRFRLCLREELSIVLPWPDRPASVPEAFTEADLAVLADRLRKVWADSAHAVAQADPASLKDLDALRSIPFATDTDEPDRPAWARVASDDDPEAIVGYIDRFTRDRVREMAASVIRHLMGKNS